MCVYPDQVAVECLNFGMFPAINFALPPSWAKADFAGYIGRRALPLGVALPARSPADLTQTQTQTREGQRPVTQAIQDRQARRAVRGRPEGGGVITQSVPACLTCLPNLPGPAGFAAFSSHLSPPNPKTPTLPTTQQHHRPTTTCKQPSRPANQQTEPPSLSLSHHHQASFPHAPALFLLHLSVNTSDKMANEVRVALQPQQAHPHSPLCPSKSPLLPSSGASAPALQLPDNLPSPVSPACFHLFTPFGLVPLSCCVLAVQTANSWLPISSVRGVFFRLG